MHSDFPDASNSNLKTCMKCLDDSNDEHFWENHQEMRDNIIWCVAIGQ
jgi:hypothetical protein